MQSSRAGCELFAEGLMKAPMAWLVLALCPACAETNPQCCLVTTRFARPQPPPPPPIVEPEPSGLSTLPSAQVLVLQSTHTDRLTEVVGVIDVHAEMGGHDAALEMLKARAAQLGADAVLGVEFHHGHGEDEPTHLSGLAVRFIDAVR
jgi:hypothetical protein